MELYTAVPTHVRFGDLLRQARIGAGLTQADLAERAGLSPRTIQHLESGLGHPFAHSAQRLAGALNLTSAARTEFLVAARRPRTRAMPTVSDDDDSAISPRAHPFNQLPVALTTFVGRERELIEVQRLIAARRQLTLTGAGGVGKTRLAIEAVRRFSDRDVGEVCWVDLAPLADPKLVPQAIALALGVPEQSARSTLDVLADALALRRVLIFLDNCEHLVAACAAVANSLLRSCPDLRMLATSRQRLGVAGETTFRVPSLAEADAKRLFVDRALAVEPDLVLSNRSESAVAEVCQRLDGIPLAIEFAAARASVLAPEQIASRLADRFNLLTIGSRVAPRRQQTLRATLDWSYELLASDEKVLFERLSVFAGGWGLEAAESVCAGGAIQSTAVLDLLTRLVDQSLVLALHGEGGPVRYRLLETLREYANQRLIPSGTADSIRNQHATFFLDVAERNEPELLGGGWKLAQAAFERDADNIRTALRWLVVRGDADRAQQLAGSAARFWFFHGYFDEGSAWLAPVLSLSGATRTAGRAKSLHGAGTIAMMRGDFAAAESALREALQLWKDLGNEAQCGFVLFVLGMVARQRGDYVEARKLFEHGLECSRGAREAPAMANNLAGLADAAREQSRLVEAQDHAEEALKCASAAGYLRGVVHALRSLGETTYLLGDYATANRQLEAGLASSRELGAQWLAAWTLARLGLLAIERSDLARAEALLDESLSLCRDMGDRQGIARALEGFGQLACVRGQAETGLRLVGAADAIRMAIGVPLSPLERDRLEYRARPVRDALGDSASEAARAAGHSLSVPEALALCQTATSG